MPRVRSLILLASVPFLFASGEDLAPPTLPSAEAPAAATHDLTVTVGKSLVVDSPINIQRVSVANGDLAEALAISPREVLVNGKAPGETSLIIWQVGGNRLFYDLTVRQSSAKIDAVREELRHELPGQDVTVEFKNDTAFVGGTVKDLVTADRAVAIASTLGKVVNLLRVSIPPVEAQILLRVRFANVDRAATQELGANLFSTGAGNNIGSVSTGQFQSGRATTDGQGNSTFTLSDALNIFLFRHDLNLAATIKALQTKRLLEMLAEPNVLAINGKPASFVAGGEFPFPTLQGGGAGLGAVTIMFREFGVRINFVPNVTPRGSIRLQVTPEVSALDFANGLVFQGFSIPALSTRRVSTEVELESGQSFAIAGLLDNRMTDTLEKVPGLANIPLLGKIFQSRSLAKNNTELLVLITPEVVRPIPASQPLPGLKYPAPFMQDVPNTLPRTPGMDVTGPVPVKPEQETMPVEQLMESQKAGQEKASPMAPIQFVPVPVAPAPTQNPNPGALRPPPANEGAAGK